MRHQADFRRAALPDSSDHTGDVQLQGAREAATLRDTCVPAKPRSIKEETRTAGALPNTSQCFTGQHLLLL